MELLERDSAVAAVEAALAEAAGAGRVVLVAGEAGIGKTALVTQVAREQDGPPLPVGCLRPAADPARVRPHP